MAGHGQGCFGGNSSANDRDVVGVPSVQINRPLGLVDDIVLKNGEFEGEHICVDTGARQQRGAGCSGFDAQSVFGEIADAVAVGIGAGQRVVTAQVVVVRPVGVTGLGRERDRKAMADGGNGWGVEMNIIRQHSEIFVVEPVTAASGG